MDFKRLLGIIIGFVILASLIFGVVMFVRNRFFPAKPVTVTTTNAPVNTMEPVPATQSAEVTGNNSAPTQNPGVTTSNTGKVFQLGNTVFRFSQNWGLLTCSNSRNFELNPYSTADQKISCDVARMPITVVVNNTQGCGGELVDMGGTRVQKSKINNARGTDYRWCLNANGTQYNITHRVSQGGARGTSKEDFSQQIEQMITRIGQPGGGS